LRVIRSVATIARGPVDSADLEKTNVVTTIGSIRIAAGFALNDTSAAVLVPGILSAESTNINRVGEGGEAKDDKEDGQEFHF